MQTPTTQSLLGAWALGRSEPQLIERALALLGAAYPDASRMELARLSIGERDALLLGLREQLFGERIPAIAPCPECGERMEFEFASEDIAVARRSSISEFLLLSVTDYELQFRLPNSLDLARVRDAGDGSQKRDMLLQGVVVHIGYRGQAISVSELPEDVVAMVEHAMLEADPQADVRLSLKCETCGHRWQSAFDIVSFLWHEIDAWAVRLLREVHCLARAYAWSESDILAMNPWRRHCYLEMLGG